MNQNIKAREVRLIGAEGKQSGIVSLEEALKQAREQGLDLVEVAANAKPPVVKVVDFKKFKYEEAKKERSAKRKTKQVDTKEIWLGPLMSENDFNTRVKHARNFLKSGDRVKLTVKFGGREIVHPEFGYKMLERAEEDLSDVGEKDSEPKLMGRNLSFSIKPSKGNRNETKNKKDS